MVVTRERVRPGGPGPGLAVTGLPDAIIADVPNSATSREDDQERRPGAVLFVYTWDLALAILALFGAFAAFAGGVPTAAGVKELPLAAQVIAGVSAAAYAATLIIIATLLTRRRTWVRLTQIGTLGAAIALAAVSVVAEAVSGNGLDTTALLGTLFFVLLDALAIAIMTERRVVGWYDEQAEIPVYIWATLGVWVGGSCMGIVVDVVLH